MKLRRQLLYISTDIYIYNLHLRKVVVLGVVVVTVDVVSTHTPLIR